MPDEQSEAARAATARLERRLEKARRREKAKRREQVAPDRQEPHGEAVLRQVLDLRIAGERLVLGDGLVASSLGNQGFKRIGFLTRRLVGAHHSEVVYLAKNCTVTAFGGEEVISPHLNAEPQFRFGSSVFLFYRSRTLSKVSMQMFGSGAAALRGYGIQRIATEVLGPPVLISGTMCRWQDDQTLLLLEFPRVGDRVFLHWLEKDAL